jgi:hypothetical protein
MFVQKSRYYWPFKLPRQTAVQASYLSLVVASFRYLLSRTSSVEIHKFSLTTLRACKNRRKLYAERIIVKVQCVSYLSNGHDKENRKIKHTQQRPIHILLRLIILVKYRKRFGASFGALGDSPGRPPRKRQNLYTMSAFPNVFNVRTSNDKKFVFFSFHALAPTSDLAFCGHAQVLWFCRIKFLYWWCLLVTVKPFTF